MKADWEDGFEMLPEYDFSSAARGAFANRWTAEEREAILRDSAFGTVKAVIRYAQEEVRELEAALFTCVVLTGDEPARPAASHAIELLDPDRAPALRTLACEARDAGVLDERLAGCIGHLAGEREWLESVSLGPYTGPGAFKPVVTRAEAIYRDARVLRRQVDERRERHLARSGMSAQEIERKTEETAKLWAAA